MIQVNPIVTPTPFGNVQYPNNPFHIGEITLQKIANIHEHVMSHAPQFIRSFMPDQHRMFYTDLPFLVVAIRDPNTGYMWSSLLENINADTTTTTTTSTAAVDTDSGIVVTSPDPSTLMIHARPVAGDALEHVFDMDDSYTIPSSSSQTTQIDVGILGIQFETARRNRVNGRITIHHNNTSMSNNNKEQPQPPLIFKVDQSFGNCPQYIKPRKQWYRTTVPTINTTTTVTDATIITNSGTSNTKITPRLSSRQVAWIETTETFFTATGYRDLNDENQETNARYGNDASHRGGPPGFVQVVVTTNGQEELQEIVWTEFNGNNFFNSLGNLIVDSRIGLCFPNFTNGGMLQITGTATVQMGNLQEGQRQVRMSIIAINEVSPGSLPIRWPSDQKKNDDDDEADDIYWSSLPVTKIVQETSNVKSFYFQRPATQNEPRFHAGQHLPIQLKNGVEVLDRRYSISSSPFAADYYRISVKRHQHGKGSSYLHDHVKVGDCIKVGSPGGSFTLEKSSTQQPTSIVLISAGIGITPLLSMLHELSSSEPKKNVPNIYWIHGAKNSKEHPFQNEMKALQESFAASHLKDKLQVRTLYSAPETNDTYDKVGRTTVQYVRDVVPTLTTDENVVVYMCGPLSFLADMEAGLIDIGVASKNILYETF